jgi:predicted kinase
MRDAPTLIIIRGNSGAGKSTVARAVRNAYGRGCALVDQDHLRRIVLREHDTGGLAARLITQTARIALDGGYHVIVEGILPSRHYGADLRALMRDHAGPAATYYLEVSLEESLRRHATRPDAPFGPDQMRAWYQAEDLLGVPDEVVIPETSSFKESVNLITHSSGLAAAPPTAWCPTFCPRCRAGASTPPT